METPALPPHRQLALPLLQVLQECGPLSPRQAADAVAEKLSLPADVRGATKPLPGYSRNGVNLFERRLRWVRQSFVKQGLMKSLERSLWDITETGEKFSREAKPGIVLTVFETENGAALWGEFQSAMGLLDDGVIRMCVTSLPYPVLSGKHYGTFTEEQVINLGEELFRGLKRTLMQDGSALLNLADCWEQGRPTRSLYQEELIIKLVREHGFHLCDKFIYHNPSTLPKTDWVTKHRVRVRSAFETFFWLSPTPHPYADNRQVLVPYGDTMRRTLEKGGDRRLRTLRPSGEGRRKAPAFAVDNGGAIPHNVIVAPNANSRGGYFDHCKRLGLTPHSARYPETGVLDTFVKMMSKPGELLADFCGGSQKLPEVAERHGRRWISVEKDLVSIRGGEGRFQGNAGFHSYAIPGEERAVLPIPA